MTFLSPAVLFGLLAASIPILIHLLNLRKLKKIDFSTLHFLKLIEKQKVRRVKLIQWLLMALRVLIVMALVAGFSRPVLEETTIPGFSTAAKTSTVILIDDSFSMEVVEGTGSYLNQAKAAAEKIISGSKDGDEISVVLTSGREDEFANPVKNPQTLRKIIKEIEPSYLETDLNAAIIRAAKILDESENLNKQLFILSDLQKSTLGERKEFTDLSQMLNPRVKIRIFDPAKKNAGNAAVVGLKINNQVFEPGKEVSVTATIRNFSGSDITNGVLSLFINDERGAQKSYSVAAGKITDVTLSAPVKKPGYSSVMVKIDDDDIKIDNQRYGSVYIPKEFSVLLLGKPGDLKFVKAAIEAGSFAGNMKITERDISQVGATDFRNINMVIVVGSATGSGGGLGSGASAGSGGDSGGDSGGSGASANGAGASAGGGTSADLQKLKDFISSGGGVLVFPGEGATLQGYSALLTALSVPVPLELRKEAKAIPGKFGSVSFTHPLLREIFQNPHGNSVESPELTTWFKIPAGGGSDIITLSEGGSFLKETRKGKGKVLTVAAAPTLGAGDLPLIPIFAPLVYRSLFYLASQEPAIQGTLTGEDISLSGKKVGAGKIEVSMPNGGTAFLQTGKNGGGVIFKETTQPGVYSFSRDDDVVEMVPVNLDSAESNTARLSDDELKEYFAAIRVKEKPLKVDNIDELTAKMGEVAGGSELWKIFIILALLLIAAEMYLSYARKKDVAKPHTVRHV
ncbi:MAG: BatA domain-containing protein [Ignavibacteriales bacterium]|nr:MAG: VWA domain-containing protein [Ignavibacteriaceae bacterium]MBW7873505.1 BatA domain-containing protein [Ignavibacteria bacterium]MCZ2142196.1 BatA domain-containing protein [Ignavibacteriales bacterium]OQY70558.1 MAG: hypothetical protein B6D45_11030 [Ignavibacteriales bacterium UTCHB3]MBV6444931.1 hypothetical protein [Ignavibacteriaceae bacterium]